MLINTCTGHNQWNCSSVSVDKSYKLPCASEGGLRCHPRCTHACGVQY